MRSSQMQLDAINILKGLAYSQLQLEDQRMKLLSTGYFNQEDVYREIDRRGNDAVYPNDLINFLSVHRIAASQREAQYLVWVAGSNDGTLHAEVFFSYLANGEISTLKHMHESAMSRTPNNQDQQLRNINEVGVANIFAKQIEYYRTIEALREKFVKSYGMQFGGIIEAIDKQRRGFVDFNLLASFIHQNSNSVQFSVEQFQALTRKISAKSKQFLTSKELTRAFSPFQPMSFPTYRKQNNIHKAIEYISEQVKKLDIEVNMTAEEEPKGKRSTGFQKVVDDYRNTASNGKMDSKYYCDDNYYGGLRQYKTNYFDPNKDVKRKMPTDIVGPQYHDHFFADYYLQLEERDKTEHYYNKFGKKYTNTIVKSTTSISRN